MADLLALASLIVRHRRMLWATTRLEFRRRYSGNLLGVLWSPLYAILFLGMYGFVYLFVFRVSVARMSAFGYVLFMFCGLVPYLGFAEAVTTGTQSIKSNINLIKNTVYPAELIPLRHVLVAMLGTSVSLAILVALVAVAGLLSWRLAYLPVPLLMLLLTSAAAAWLCASLAALLPDIGQVVNIIVLMLLFTAPIGYQLADAQGVARTVSHLNPVTYLIESFRFALIGRRDTPIWSDFLFAAAALLVAGAAGVMFRRLKPLFTDYE